MSEVSAVITTVNRPKILSRALDSVLNQTYGDMEIVVVVDGGAKETTSFLKHNYPEVKIVTTNKSVGGSEARNIGINTASHKYIALLDDDDEWLPEKIQTQINLAKSKSEDNICIFGAIFTYVKNSEKMFVFSKREFKNERIADYIFNSKFGFRTGGFQTSTIFAPKSVFQKVPFRRDLPKHQDWTWAIDAENYGINLLHINKPLSIYHKISNGVSKQFLWQFSKNWLDDNKNNMTKKSYYNFLNFVILNGISKDNSISKKEKLHLIKKIKKQIPFLRKMSLTSIRYSLQVCYQIFK
ncbi:MAG TPA: glycosyltransferase family 2 protein [Flavobacteriaceae bacterium]|nr:glycosyltransferase family 2 protein [Flavobacteriaceae bacterium]